MEWLRQLALKITWSVENIENFVQKDITKTWLSRKYRKFSAKRYNKDLVIKNHVPGWVEVKAVLRTALSSQKVQTLRSLRLVDRIKYTLEIVFSI